MATTKTGWDLTFPSTVRLKVCMERLERARQDRDTIDGIDPYTAPLVEVSDLREQIRHELARRRDEIVRGANSRFAELDASDCKYLQGVIADRLAELAKEEEKPF